MPPLGISFCAELVGELPIWRLPVFRDDPERRFWGQDAGVVLQPLVGGNPIRFAGLRRSCTASMTDWEKSKLNHPIGCCLFMEFTFSSNAGR